MKIRKGDIVGRISYNKDILFSVEKIIHTNIESPIVILKGITHRIVADAPLADLELIHRNRITRSIKNLDYKLESRINTLNPQKSKNIFKRSLPREYKKYNLYRKNTSSRW